MEDLKTPKGHFEINWTLGVTFDFDKRDIIDFHKQNQIPDEVTATTLQCTLGWTMIGKPSLYFLPSSTFWQEKRLYKPAPTTCRLL